MKNLFLSVVVTVFFLGLTSCSTNETQDFQELNAKEALLKSYKLQKDINGRYSIDYTLNSNTASESVKNVNSNDIYLYSGEVDGKEKHNESLALDNNQLKLNFIENSKTKTSLVLEDEDIVLAKGQSNNKFLQDYSFTVNPEEKTVALDFKVRDGVNVAFSYNENEDIYEIHLKEGESNDLSFSKVFVNNGSPIKIDFVNHLINAQAKGGEVTTYRRTKRPRILVNQ